MDQQVLLKAGANVDAKTDSGYTPIIVAASIRQVDVVEVTVKKLLA